MGLAEDVERIAAAASRRAGAAEQIAAVLPVEPADGERIYLCAFEDPGGAQTWLALDDRGAPVTDRTRVRDAASIAALVEIAEEGAAVQIEAEPRVASAAYLDSLAANGRANEVFGSLQGALPAIEELTRDVELHYKLELI
ncbi:MAG TPA: hypothetical protein VF025_11270 [Gaiellaceae bacterium]